MRVNEAVRRSLRQYADRACRQCRGSGYRSELSEDSACACVKRRAPSASGDLPHPWPAVMRRAQEMLAAEKLGQAPDSWV